MVMRTRQVTVMVVVLGMLTVADAGAARSRSGRRSSSRNIDISVGSSERVGVGSLERVVVGNPDVIDVVSLPGASLLLTGKQPGLTHVTVTGRDGSVSTYHVNVGYSAEPLREALKLVFPNEETLRVDIIADIALLQGTVSNATVADAAARIARVHFENKDRAPKVINLLRVAGEQQVQVQLRFVEISRTAMRALGVNAWHQHRNKNGAVDMSGGISGPSWFRNDVRTFSTEMADTLPMLTSPIQGTFSILFAQGGVLPFTATLSLLQARRVAKVLSEPTLVAMSGEEAKFLVGGEFPVPIPDNTGRVSIEFKEFGVQLKLLPTILADNTVQLKLAATVSNLDASAGITILGGNIPGLKSRYSETNVRLKSGQSFAIAGLVSDSIRGVTQKVPLFGELPIVGMFFRAVDYQREETELVVLTSVNLVSPLAAKEVPRLPAGGEFNDPNDLQLFLNGTVDVSVDPAKVPRAGRAAVPLGRPAGSIGFAR